MQMDYEEMQEWLRAENEKALETAIKKPLEGVDLMVQKKVTTIAVWAATTTTAAATFLILSKSDDWRVISTIVPANLVPPAPPRPYHHEYQHHKFYRPGTLDLNQSTQLQIQSQHLFGSLPELEDDSAFQQMLNTDQFTFENLLQGNDPPPPNRERGGNQNREVIGKNSSSEYYDWEFILDL
jgi:hypothetical protein